MKIISFASIILPGASAAFPEAQYRFDTSGGRCSSEYGVHGITSFNECQEAMSDEGTQGTVSAIEFGNWQNGCFKNNAGLWFNTGFDPNQREEAEQNFKNYQAQWLCKEKEAEALHRFDTSGGQCADPSYDVDGFTSAEECKQALGDEGTDTSNFQAINAGDWFNGCFKNNWGGPWYNTGFNGDSAVAQGHVDGSEAQYLCKKKPPTASPTAPPTEPVFASEKCEPMECDNWTCKSWCKCFKAHPEIIEIFEGPNPSAGEQRIRNMCPSDGQDECDCTEFHFGNAKKEVASSGDPHPPRCRSFTLESNKNVVGICADAPGGMSDFKGCANDADCQSQCSAEADCMGYVAHPWGYMLKKYVGPKCLESRSNFYLHRCVTESN